MERIFEHEGTKYVRVNKHLAVPFNDVDANGKPIIKAESEDFINEHGIPSKRVKVNCLTISPASLNP